MDLLLIVFNMIDALQSQSEREQLTSCLALMGWAGILELADNRTELTT
ncbi:hypothetical protein LPH50_04570 [Xylella taiwanensis]|uniref:Uncharacterized protein n=1 Tax=Xylella taiwanensis TaxID=1444770 RepID=A0ABS8TTU8_9GAMM|nr:hypothetical protein [Xylella taiwanensis]MCD8457501.1 hypothetical protein [Xylella taiwanensis]MCD8457660.1 hypothetical protein [Xylella taiwanensis]MCD8461215.1 hypothetical protein [Xylella taiwanensis]MCD8462749.1 hypothetical protein [Xylella taiwanensis]MCD8466536.1 hypothetical protein [Xylella taiwanensis]